MVQYLVNMSVIWLAGLIAYDMLFSRERFHAYNRIYLLTFLATGLLLPILNFTSPLAASASLFDTPVAQVYELKNFTVTTALQQSPATTAQNHVSYQAVLWSVYFTGLVIGLLLIGRETYSLYKLYSSGKKQKENGRFIVETGKEHGPFSFFNIIFVGSRHHYNATQWAFLIAHEQEHSRRLHSVDKIALIILRLVLWFHPLPHIYYKRLMMVHEYEADNAAATDVETYGHFLLEQNMLREATPMLTHRLYNSPIKKRIAMLTQSKNSNARLFKYFAVFPLLLVLTLFCTKTSFSEQPAAKGNKIFFNGNEIEFAPIKIIPSEYQETLRQQKTMFMQATLPDSVLVKDLVNGGMKMLPVTSDMIPTALNGKPVYGNEPQYLLPDADTKYTTPVLNHETGNLEKYLFTQLKQELDKLPDGGYNLKINRMVIDDHGKIAYYEVEGISIFAHPLDKKSIVTDDLKESIKSRLSASLDAAPQFTPALKDGKPVNVRVTVDDYEIIVKNHQAQLVERTGC